MKTSELIRQLQETDPSGELEVTVGKTDIHFVDKLPGYYDGCYEVLKRDPNSDHYNIIGGEYRGGGQHVEVFTLSIKSALWNDASMPVTFDGEYAETHCKARIERWRNEVLSFEQSERKKKEPTP